MRLSPLAALRRDREQLYLRSLLTFLQTVFFVLPSMGPTYIGNNFSFLSQIVFSNMNLKKGTFLQSNFLQENDPK
jgi:hypothetical protein